MIRIAARVGRPKLSSNQLHAAFSSLTNRQILSNQSGDCSLNIDALNQRGAAFGSFGRRTFSTDGNSPLPAEGAAIGTPSINYTIDKLFMDQEVANTAEDAIASTVWDPTWYNVADQAIEGINMFRDVTGMGYGVAIVGSTLTIRLVMFPLFVKLQQNTARLAHMQPEMLVLRAKLESLGDNVDQDTQVKYGLQMKGLFKKYGCNPLTSILPPLIQMPIFMGMFFGLRKMQDFDNFSGGLSNEGLFWFQDLTTYDPLYILPVVSACTMLASVEMNKDAMMANNPTQGLIMINVFRAMAVIMVPMVCQFTAALNLYWVCNNTVTALQAGLFRSKAVRKQLGIWEMPKPVPGMPQASNIMDTIKDAVERKPSEKQLIKDHNQNVEIKNRTTSMTQPQRGRKKGRRKFRARTQ